MTTQPNSYRITIEEVSEDGDVIGRVLDVFDVGKDPSAALGLALATAAKRMCVFDEPYLSATTGHFLYWLDQDQEPVFQALGDAWHGWMTDSGGMLDFKESVCVCVKKGEIPNVLRAIMVDELPRDVRDEAATDGERPAT